MDNDFPDADEDFDLAHEDEFELLNELNGFEGSPVAKTANKPAEQKKSQESSTQINNQKPRNAVSQTQNSATFNTQNNSTEDESMLLDSMLLSEFTQPIEPSQGRELSKKDSHLSSLRSRCHKEINKTNLPRKRTVEELVEDVSVLLAGENFENAHLFEPEHVVQRQKMPRWSDYDEVMKVILEERKKLNSKEPIGLSYKKRSIQRDNVKRDSISTRVPNWNFIAITRNEDGQRLYIRVTDEKKQVVAKTRPASGLLSVSYSQLKTEAEEIIVKNVERASLPEPTPVSNENIDDELWVDKYRPKKYLELLSDESINRNFLHWLKLWDKIVFNREPIKHKRRKLYETNKNFGKRNFNNQNNAEDFDSKGYPSYRIALLSGPPGLGKTTLAHVAARHAGYNIVEINASDDREPSAFREALLSSTQMKAVIGADPRPNCLILDEIDGAPSASIDLLIKFIQGKLVQKGKKSKQTIEKMKQGCQRPVICICNDLYAPALRQLKAMALVIPVPEIQPTMLADRLMEIARKEGLNVELRDLIKLAERSGCDIRTCLGALQYMRGANLKENLSLGMKDTRKGLFDSWKTLLQVPMTQKGFFSSQERIKLVLKTAYQGDSERLAQGVFHNYPMVCKDKMEPVARSLQWFQFFDEIRQIVSARQIWTIMAYTNYAFVIWHFDLASQQNPKLSYPTTAFEMNQKLVRNQAILTASQKACAIDKLTLALDIAPLLPELLTPRLRSVSAHLYSSKEKAELMHLVNVMLDYGLTLIQEKKPEGGFEYNLDPDLLAIGVFPDCKFRRGLSYAVKQIVIQELEVERVKRAAAILNTANKSQVNQKQVAKSGTIEDKTEGEETPSQVPNHLKQKLDPVAVKPVERKYQDFFKKFKDMGQEKLIEQQRLEPENSNSGEKNSSVNKMLLFKKDVWYKFKEGFTNAVRRNIKMEDLL